VSNRPQRFSEHPNNAEKAAEAARCILEQDREKYWEYHDKLFANGSALGQDNLKKFAADLQFDTEKFNACLDSGKYVAAINEDMADGTKIGVSGTPAFLINGRFLSGAQPFGAFQEAIERPWPLRRDHLWGVRNAGLLVGGDHHLLFTEGTRWNHFLSKTIYARQTVAWYQPAGIQPADELIHFTAP
jgi:hypothetical protein